MAIRSLVHTNPVWRDRADFIIGIRCSEEGTELREWEQLWSQRIGDNRFVICCIPFFVYNLSLGDEVETGEEWGKPYMVQRVVRSSGHSTFRVWFGNSTSPDAREELLARLTKLEALYEWGSDNLLAIDAASDSQAQDIANLLWHYEQLQHLVYETGRI